MPTYEYRCKDCGEHLEVAQSFRDAPLTECHSCSGTLKKVFQPIGIAFKGSGFYRNDSRTTAGSKATSSTKTGDASGSNGSDSSAGSDSSSGTNGSNSSSASSESSATNKDSATASSQAHSA